MPKLPSAVELREKFNLPQNSPTYNRIYNEVIAKAIKGYTETRVLVNSILRSCEYDELVKDGYTLKLKVDNFYHVMYYEVSC